METNIEDKLQALYIKLLRSHPIISLLDSPTKVFEELCLQEIEAVRHDPEKLRREIRSSPVFLQQGRTLLRQVLLKTSYKELRRVEAALTDGIQQLSGNDEYVSNQIHRVRVAFEGIHLELQVAAAGQKIDFLQAIPTHQSPGDEVEEVNDGDSVGLPLIPTESDPVPSTPNVLKQQLFYTVSELQQKEELEKFLARPGIKEKQVWTYEGFTILHDAATSSNPTWAVELITTVMKFIDENEDFPWTAQGFLDEQQQDDGSTALHLAVLRGSIPAVKCLIDHGANILIRDHERFTPLDLMYEEMPEALLYNLSQSGVTSYGNLKQKNVTVRLDFGSFIDRLRTDGPKRSGKECHKDCESKNMHSNGGQSDIVMEMAEVKENAESPDVELESSLKLVPEMDRLAHTIYRCFETTAPQLLSHIVVKIFLELKWKKLKWPIYFLTLFYIALYMSYTSIAIYVFILKFPYADNSPTDSNATGVNSIAQASAVRLDPGAFISFGIAMALYVGLEIYQYYLIFWLSARTGWEALLFYLRDLENVLQLLFMMGAFAIMGALLSAREKPEEQDWTYWIAAYSVVIAWILILLQLGNFYGLGKYVHMFQTVFTRFSTVMGLYLCFLIGFNIACGIVFPQVKEFSYPRSFFRSFAMLTGELNFDEVFKPEESRPFELAALTIYLGSIIVVTIVVGNLLIGLTVDDVSKIFKEADAIHRTIQVERLYILERLLFSLRIPWDIFVVAKDRRIDGAVVFTDMGKFPRELQRELRCLLADPKEYEQEYLEFD